MLPIGSHFRSRSGQEGAADRCICYDAAHCWRILKVFADGACFRVKIAHHAWFVAVFRKRLLFLDRTRELQIPRLQEPAATDAAAAQRASAAARLEASDNDYDDSDDGSSSSQASCCDPDPSVIDCFRQLKLEQEALRDNIDAHRRYVRNVEAAVVKDMAEHKRYFEHLSSSPSPPAPNFPASPATLLAIAMWLTDSSNAAPGSFLATVLALLRQREQTTPNRIEHTKLSAGEKFLFCPRLLHRPPQV